MRKIIVHSDSSNLNNFQTGKKNPLKNEITTLKFKNAVYT